MESIILLPAPKKLRWTQGTFQLPAAPCAALPEAFVSLAALLPEGWSVEEGDCVRFERRDGFADEGYALSVTPKGARLAASTPCGAFRALTTLGQLLLQTGGRAPCCEIEDEPALAVRGFMLDISRGKVPTLQNLCALADRLAMLKYNQLQLYIEGFSFAYPSFPQYWMDQTPLTGEEIRYLDAYCKARFIELVPNQNSLGHMADWIARPELHHLAVAEAGAPFFGRPTPPSTLDPQNPESLALVVRMMDDLLPFFSSDTFNVNLDEPFELGTGKSREAAEKVGVAKLYTDYLNALHREVTARGKKMILWGDVLTAHPEAVGDVPKDVTVLDWGYEADSPFEEHAALLAKAGVPFLLCPGTSTWLTLSGRTDNMLENIRSAASAALRHGARGVLLTEWGDLGHAEYEPLNEPALAHAAACCWSGAPADEGMLARWLDRFVFMDDAGVMGALVLELGRSYRFEEFRVPNMTLGRVLLMLGLTPRAALEKQIGDMARRIAQTGSEETARQLAERGEFDYEGALAHLDALRGRLAQSRMRGPSAVLYYGEAENAIRMASFAHGLHYACLHMDEMDAGEKRAFLASLCETGEALLRAHPALWLARNRLHGMENSVAMFARAIEQLRAAQAG